MTWKIQQCLLLDFLHWSVHAAISCNKYPYTKVIVKKKRSMTHYEKCYENSEAYFIQEDPSLMPVGKDVTTAL